ncbi:MAG: leucine-rich repeat domain-containing protein [Candidatus Methanoplasma sp.]|nr:leucine-rich repeat domain-containing protein [Candidatus Methanoplasma sp.]
MFLAAAFFITYYGSDESDAAGGKTGNLTWNLTGNALRISGTGAMTDYATVGDRPWHDEAANIQSVVIEQGVTSIGNNAFYDCTSLTSDFDHFIYFNEIFAITDIMK